MEPRRYNHLNSLTYSTQNSDEQSLKIAHAQTLQEKNFGQLVRLGFAIAAFTPASYQRRRLQRPSMEI